MSESLDDRVSKEEKVRKGPQVSANGVRRRPMRPALKISVDRVDSTSASDWSVVRSQGVANYMSRHREKRLRRGDMYLRRCVTACVASIAIAGYAPQYSRIYYIAILSGSASFFLSLPAVLPTDNKKICTMLAVMSINMSALMTFEASKMVEKFWLYSTHQCSGVLCLWNIYYWFGHSVITATTLILLAHAACRLRPAESLQRFWHVVGIFSLFCAVHSCADVIVELFFLQDDISQKGKQEERKQIQTMRSQQRLFYRALWKFSLTFEWLVMGLLASSTKFKVFMWKYCASQASISVRAEVRHLPWRQQLRVYLVDISHNVFGYPRNTVNQDTGSPGIVADDSRKNPNYVIKKKKQEELRHQSSHHAAAPEHKKRRGRRRDRANSGSSSSESPPAVTFRRPERGLRISSSLCRRDCPAGIDRVVPCRQHENFNNEHQHHQDVLHQQCEDSKEKKSPTDIHPAHCHYRALPPSNMILRSSSSSHSPNERIVRLDEDQSAKVR